MDKQDVVKMDKQDVVKMDKQDVVKINGYYAPGIVYGKFLPIEIPERQKILKVKDWIMENKLNEFKPSKALMTRYSIVSANYNFYGKIDNISSD